MPNAPLQEAPDGWVAQAHAHWQQGKKQAAIEATLAVLNRYGPEKPLPAVLQLAYYIFLSGDYRAAAHFLELARPHHPRSPQLLLNLAVCLARSREPGTAVERLNELLVLEPDNPVAFDCLCSAYHQLGRHSEAAAAGARALTIKDNASAVVPEGNWLPSASPADWADGAGKTRVIAFSLWGSHPRYLRGAIDNALAGPTLYPGWTLRFFVDDSVPIEVREALATLGANIALEPAGQSQRQRLAWRFKVANDPGVGRFLVRDVDSVINAREKSAVDEWLVSGRWFHVMRDWWTHTDLMLAGMWGGVAGVLPDLTSLLAVYKAPAIETPNIDQWFLRDKVWPFVRTSCLVHDRCFRVPGSHPWPPGTATDRHVGQDMFAVEREEQEHRLGQWLTRLHSLHLPRRP